MPPSGIRRLTIAKMSILSKLTYRFSAISKSRRAFFVEIDKLILKSIWQYKGPKTAKTLLKTKIKVGELTLPPLKTCYKATIIKTAWCCLQNRQIDQWNRIESRNRSTSKQWIDFGQIFQDNSMEKQESF